MSSFLQIILANIHLVIIDNNGTVVEKVKKLGGSNDMEGWAFIEQCANVKAARAPAPPSATTVKESFFEYVT